MESIKTITLECKNLLPSVYDIIHGISYQLLYILDVYNSKIDKTDCIMASIYKKTAAIIDSIKKFDTMDCIEYIDDKMYLILWFETSDNMMMQKLGYIEFSTVLKILSRISNPIKKEQHISKTNILILDKCLQKLSILEKIVSYYAKPHNFCELDYGFAKGIIDIVDQIESNNETSDTKEQDTVESNDNKCQHDSLNDQATDQSDNTVLCNPKIVDGIYDLNNNRMMRFTSDGCAVNEVRIMNAKTNQGPTLMVSGDDENINLNILSKGKGNIYINGIKYPRYDGQAGQVLKTDGRGNLLFSYLDLNSDKSEAIDYLETDTGDETNLFIVNTSIGRLYMVESNIFAKNVETNAAITYTLKFSVSNNNQIAQIFGKSLLCYGEYFDYKIATKHSGENVFVNVVGKDDTIVSWKSYTKIMYN